VTITITQLLAMRPYYRGPYGLWRGHLIRREACGWVYVSDDTAVARDPNRACGSCGRRNTEEGHDACLGELEGVQNACCGHGDLKQAYVQFCDDSLSSLHGAAAIKYFVSVGVLEGS